MRKESDPNSSESSLQHNRNSIYKKCLAAFLAAALFTLSRHVPAETLIYDGSEPGMLRPDPFLDTPSLFPDAASGNRVIVNSGSIAGSVFGSIKAGADLSNNQVSINGGRIGETVYGALAINGDVTLNAVTVNAGEINDRLYGGYSADRNADFNTVTLNGGHVSGTVMGGYSYMSASHNRVIVNSGTIEEVIYAGYATSGDAAGNSVITDGDIRVGGNVYGGYSSLRNAVNNHVLINDGLFSAGKIYGGYATSGSATGNSVTINKGTIPGDVYGGYSMGNNGNANNNSVTINGGTLWGNISGGYSASGSAGHNTVTLTGNKIYGSVFGGIGSGEQYTGNTLNVSGNGIAIDGILANFEQLNFTISGKLPPGQALLEVKGSVNWGGSSTTINSINIAAGGRALSAGDTITLVQAGEYQQALDAASPGSIKAKKGFALLYDFDITETMGTNGGLNATVRSVSINPVTAAFPRARAAGMAMVNSGADMAAGTGIRHLGQAACGGSDTFAAVEGNTSRYGAGINMDTVTVMGGSVFRNCRNDHDIAFAVFAEAGLGDYRSHTNLPGQAGVRGKGDLHYYGLGLLGSIKAASGIYADASLRFGRAETEFAASHQSFMGQGAEFTSNSVYAGAHGTIGYVMPLSTTAELDLYGRYLFSWLESDSVKVAQDRYHLGSVTSHRLRVGGRYHNGSGKVMPYLAAAYEYEFDGEAGGHVYNLSIKDARLRGGTVIGEAGLQFRLHAHSRFTAQVAVEGYAGERDGFGGIVRGFYRF